MKKAWLGICCLTLLLIISVGGFTRLTGSGLSIVEWKPVTGVIPPLTEKDWEKEFSEYRSSPEFIKINRDMDLGAFKKIFWPEFIHRILGRFIGIIYFVPLLYFLIKKEIGKKEYKRYALIGFLIPFQGFVGWYMVKSGLKDSPFVSHFRLALHLILAALLYSLLFTAFLKNIPDLLIIGTDRNLAIYRFLWLASLKAVALQIFLGALVSGLDAGLLYNEFPLMGGSFVPDSLDFKNFGFSFFSDGVFVQFIHRLWAYSTFLITLYASYKSAGLRHRKINRALFWVFAALISQMSTGIATLLSSVALPWALSHQIGAFILLSSVLRLYLLFKGSSCNFAEKT